MTHKNNELEKDAATPNDPKLSDCGARRDPCAGEGGEGAKAAGSTGHDARNSSLQRMVSRRSLRVLDEIEKADDLEQQRAVADAAKACGGVVVVRYSADALIRRKVYGVDSVALCEIGRASGRVLFWENAAVHELLSDAKRLAGQTDGHHNG